MSYLFLQEADELTKQLEKKYDQLATYGTASGMHKKWRSAYNSYYSSYFMDNLGIGSAGEQLELATLHVNHLRNIIRHIFNMATQNKLVFDALAINSDVQSRNEAIVANAVLEYYFSEKKFEVQTRAALEMALVFGTAFLKVCWEPNQEIYGAEEDEFGNLVPVYKGAPRFIALSPYDVLLDPTKDDYNRQNWVVTRETENRWDLQAIYQDKSEEIENLPKIDALQYFMPYWENDEDSVFVYRAYHKPTPALPKGRYTVFCEGGIVLSDEMENPYGALPVFCIRPETKYGGAYGHSTIFDLLPAQEAHNLLHSTIISNQKAFGVQNVAVFKESDINPSEIPGQLNILEVKYLDGAPNGGLPQPLNLCSTPAEVFKYNETLVSQMEMISGVNSAARGAPPSNLSSGTAIALVSTAASTFNSSVEQAYITLCEQSASFLVKVLQERMKVEEIIAISGSHSTASVQSFKGDSIKGIKRVRILTGNALSKTLAGKTMIADNLLMNQALTGPSQYLEILQTGTLAPVLEDGTAEDAYIKTMVDYLAKGISIPILATDNHIKCIKAIRDLTYRPDIRANSDILAVTLNALQEHIDMFEEMSVSNPQLLAVALGQPIQVAPPQPGMPGSPEAGMAPGGPQGAPAPQGPGQVSQTAEAAAEGPEAAAASGMKRAEGVMQKVSQQQPM